MQFDADAPKPATGGQVTLFVNDKPVGGGRMDHTVPVRFSGYAGMDIGRDNGGVVDLSYDDRKPFAFTGHDQEGRLRHQASPVDARRAGPARGGSPRPRGTRARGMRSSEELEEESRWPSMTRQSTS